MLILRHKKSIYSTHIIVRPMLDLIDEDDKNIHTMTLIDIIDLMTIRRQNMDLWIRIYNGWIISIHNCVIIVLGTFSLRFCVVFLLDWIYIFF